MKKKNVFNKICAICILSFFVALATAQNTDQNSTDLQTDQVATFQKAFLRGNFKDKISVINSLPQDSDQYHSLIRLACEYIITCGPYFSSDTEFEDLVVAVVKRCNPLQKEDFELLESMYMNVIDQNSKIPILIALTKVSPQPIEVTEKLADYIETVVIAGNNYEGEQLEQTLTIAAESKNETFFPILFKCYSNTSSDIIKKIAKKGIDNLAPDYKKDVLKIIENNSIKDIQLILNLIITNDTNSDFFKAEIAENAFKAAINKVDSISETTPELIALQLTTLDKLVLFSWTRASSLVDKFYKIAIEEYNNKLLTNEQFIQVILGYAKLAPTKASITLTSYLGEMNTQFEENGTYSEPIMIAVTQTLGDLGNHIAFDNLLYTTYLDYSEDVLTAARDALVKLKW
ncbi:MAG: hypothetical protein BKP49_08675 [Treponema sp. CETP13]|nr:MAG: hypothetical protein BKP49_08675 [Treponema sp. CETP13]